MFEIKYKHQVIDCVHLSLNMSKLILKKEIFKDYQSDFWKQQTHSLSLTGQSLLFWAHFITYKLNYNC